MSDTAVRVGVLGGLELAGNVRTLLENVRRLLRTRPTSFDCDLLLAPGVTAPEGYNPVRSDVSSVGSARERIVALFRALRQYADREDPDVLFQVTRFPTHGTATALAGRLSGVPTVTRLAGDNFREYRFAPSLADRLRTFALKNVIALVAVHLPDAVVALGPSGRRDLRSRLRRRRVWTIPQPVDRERFSPVADDERARLRDGLDMPSPGEGRVLLTVGRVSRRKGADAIRRTAPELPPDATWYVVGDGPLREDLAAVSGVEPVGRVPHDRVRDYYRAADLYVHPSLHDGLPNTLLEATACGTPSVARDVGECRTVATETFDDDGELPELCRCTYDPVELPERFDPERLGERYEALFAEVAR